MPEPPHDIKPELKLPFIRHQAVAIFSCGLTFFREYPLMSSKLQLTQMETLEEIKSRAEQAVSGAKITIIPNSNPVLPSSLLLDHGCAMEVAKFLRDDPALKLDHCSNVSGVDWLDRVIKTKIKVKQVVEGVETEVEEEHSEAASGYLEAVYHLFSMTLKQGPVVVRLRTVGRGSSQTDSMAPDEAEETALGKAVYVPSLTPVYRSAELQEREIYDLYGIHFTGHPDLRRILMWDEFLDHPMRKDYIEPDDYEYEPTAHGAVLDRTKKHFADRPGQDGCEQMIVEGA